MGEAVFLMTWGTQRGGLGVGIGVQSKEKFLKDVDAWNEKQQAAKWVSYPKYRYAFMDGQISQLFKNMTVTEFEAIFNEADRKRLGMLLEYGRKTYGDKYPVFLKAVYLKYGYEYTESK
jgi:hypothetical protein